jgi:putative intracellular protease/amidase
MHHLNAAAANFERAASPAGWSAAARQLLCCCCCCRCWFLQLVPFLLEDKLTELGGDFSRVDDWGEYVVVDGNLITGQNPGAD